jgi:hypothetical protein
MNKPFLLIAGNYYYPQGGSEDWVRCFSSREEALELVVTVDAHTYFTKGRMKGEIKSTLTTFVIKGGEKGGTTGAVTGTRLLT